MSNARVWTMAVNLHEQASTDADKADALVQAYRMLMVSLGADPYDPLHHIDSLLAGHRSTLERKTTRRIA